MHHRLKDDLFVVVGSINPTTKRATFRIHVNPLVSWIWFGVVVAIGGATISLWPEVSWRRLGVWGSIRLATSAAGGIMLAILVASAPTRAGTRGPSISEESLRSLPPATHNVGPLGRGSL